LRRRSGKIKRQKAKGKREDKEKQKSKACPELSRRGKKQRAKELWTASPTIPFAPVLSGRAAVLTTWIAGVSSEADYSRVIRSEACSF
jgi:hypothetical protein